MNINELKTFYGTVCWFSNKKGFGFINQECSETDIFVHYSDIASAPGAFKTLKKDQKVSYQVGLNKNSVPKAINIVVVGE